MVLAASAVGATSASVSTAVTGAADHVVGIVDLPSLLLLHPRMQEFNFSALRFRRPQKLMAGVSFMEAENQFQEGVERLRIDLTSLQLSERDRKSELDQELIALRTSLTGAELQQAQLRRTKEFYADYEQQKSDLYKTLDKWLFTEEETIDIFRQIHAEIRTTLEDLIKKYNLSLIVPVRNLRQQKPEPALHRLNSQSPALFRNDFDRFLNGRIYGSNGQEYLTELSFYLAHYDDLASHIRPFFTGSLVVAGGLDLTAEAIDLLWQTQENIDAEVKEQIRKAWEYWYSL